MAQPDLAIGDALFAGGAITGEQLAEAKAKAEEDGRHVAPVLLELGHADLNTLVGALDRCWEDDATDDPALARALELGELCEPAVIEAARFDAAEALEEGKPGRLASLLILRGQASSADIARAREIMEERANAAGDVDIDALSLDEFGEGDGDDLPSLDADGDGNVDLDVDAEIDADAEIEVSGDVDLDDLSLDDDDDDGDLPMLGEGDDSGFERIEPAAASRTPDTLAGQEPPPTLAGGTAPPPPTHYGNDAPTLADAGAPPPTLAGGGAPPTLFGGRETPEPDPDIDQVVAGYTLLRQVAHGELGTAYEAIREDDGLRVGLKLLAPEHAADVRLMAKLRESAEAARELLHDNIARVVDLHLPEEGAAEGDAAWVAAEWAEGENIDQLLRRARMPVDRVARIGIQAARALHQGHERKLIHGRLSPSAIVLDMGDRAIVTGIGTPSLAGAGRTPTGPTGGATFNSYAPPEAAAGPDAVDARSDVYALGATLYEMMTGQAPYPPGSAKDLAKRGKGEGPTSPRKLNPRVPPAAEAILLQALSHEPNRRYATAQALAEDLERFRRGERVKARGAGWLGQHKLLVVGAAAVLAAAVGTPVYLVSTGSGGDGGPEVASFSFAPPPTGINTPGTGPMTAGPSAEKIERETSEASRLLGEGRADEAARKMRTLLTRLRGKGAPDVLRLAARAYRETGDLKGAEEQLAAVTAAEQGNATAATVVERGMLALAEGRYEEALADIDMGLAAASDESVTQMGHYGKGLALLALGRAPEAASVLAKAGNDAATLAELSAAQLAMGDVDAAEKTARTATGKPRPPAVAHYALAKALEAQLKPEEARRRYTQSASPAHGSKRKGQTDLDRLRAEIERLNSAAPAMLTKIEQELRAGQWRRNKEAAESLLKRCSIALDRAYTEQTAIRLRFLRMIFAYALRQHDLALADANELLAPRAVIDQSTVVPALQRRMQIRYSRGNPAGALADATALLVRLSRNPNPTQADGQIQAQAMNLRMAAALLFGDYAMAAADADRYLAAIPQNAPAGQRAVPVVFSGLANGMLGKAAFATQSRAQLKELLGSEQAPGYQALTGAVRAGEGKWTEAIAAFEAELAVENSPFTDVVQAAIRVARSHVKR
ncbi:MAG: protein kinase domain-containing protein [Planctomycetota bacterium]|jgi:tetratricopeptide (TPR) repeat protein